MMKRLLFTSAIALFSVITFAQNGNYNPQKRNQPATAQQGSYQQNASHQTTINQPVTQQPNSGYTQNSQYGYGNNVYQQNAPANNNYQQNQPYRSYSQERDFGNSQGFQRDRQRTPEQDEYNRHYAPVYHQMQYRQGFRKEQYHGHGYYDQHGNYCY